VLLDKLLDDDDAQIGVGLGLDAVADALSRIITGGLLINTKK